MTGSAQVRWGIIGTANIARAVFLPGGVGVREGLLLALLPPLLAGQPIGSPDGVAAAAVLLLRLVWTVAELLMVALAYWLPGPGLEDSDE